MQVANGISVTSELQPSTKRLKQTGDEEEEEEGSTTIPATILRGRNESNRPWKSVRKQKASMVYYKQNKKTLGSTWEQKQLKRLERKQTKEFQDDIVERRKSRLAREKEEREARARRKAENELKSTKYQVLSNPGEKIKKMNKKQLKQIYKTRMGDDGVVRLVGMYE